MERLEPPRGEPPIPPPSRELRALVRASPPAAPRRPRRELALCVVACLLPLASSLALRGVRADLPHLAPLLFWSVAAGWFAAFVLSLASSLVPPRGSALSSRSRSLGAALTVPSLALSVGGLLRSEDPSATVIPRGASAILSLPGCIAWGLIMVAATLGVGALALRGASVVPGERWPGAAVGSGGGALAGLLLHLQCDVGGALHVTLAHGSLPAIGAALGAALLPLGAPRDPFPSP